MTPSATGTLAATPLAHALVYARNRRLTGRLELMADDERTASISLWRGSITAVETKPIGICPGGFLGAVVYELGFIDSAMLDSTLLEIAKTKRLHGEILIERSAITAAQRDEALVEQIHRKIHYLFSFSPATTYAFFDAKAPADEPSVAVDCVGPVWRGIRDFPPAKFVEETIRRVGDNALRATTGGSARLPPIEAALTQALSAYPMTLTEMKAETELPPGRVELLVYLLVIAKCVEAVSGARTHPSTGALPVAMPSGPVRMPSVETRRPTPQAVAAYRTDVPGSSPRLPATTGSSGRLPAVTGSSPRLPAQAASRTSPSGAPAVIRTPAEYGLDGIVTRAARVQDESYFEVLGVSDGASAEAVRAAFMRLAKAWHPDRLVADFNPVRGEVAKIFSHMTQAQKTLCDNDARRAYVASRKASNARPRKDVVREIESAFTTRQFDTVMQLCDELIAEDSDDAEALALHTWASVRGGEASEDELRIALTKGDRAVNMDRTSDQAVYHRALIHKRLNNIPAAFRDFARALQINPKHLEAEREVRIFAMRVRKGSGEHKLIAPILEKLDKK